MTPKTTKILTKLIASFTVEVKQKMFEGEVVLNR